MAQILVTLAFGIRKPCDDGVGLRPEDGCILGKWGRGGFREPQILNFQSSVSLSSKVKSSIRYPDEQKPRNEVRQEGRSQARIWAATRDLVTNLGSMVFSGPLGSFLVFSLVYSFYF